MAQSNSMPSPNSSMASACEVPKMMESEQPSSPMPELDSVVQELDIGAAPVPAVEETSCEESMSTAPEEPMLSNVPLTSNESCPEHVPLAEMQEVETAAEVLSETRVSPSITNHKIKKVLWKERTVPVVTQNENGPCPLIAITNVLLLREKIKLPPNIETVSADQLLDLIGNAMLENDPNLSPADRANFEQNMSDAMMILPKLQTGLDVNVKFTGVRHFEYTQECIIFDLLNISLYHGWLVDPQALETVKAVGTCGYNQLVEKMINNKCSSQTERVTEALIAEQFLERSASQLTYHGLCELIASMKEDELAVFFRNNHFSTLYKRKNELFQLVTDQGFLNEARVIWETLCNIEGDGEFVDGKFVTVPPKPAEGEITPLPAGASEEQQINHDYLVALSLQEEHKKQQEKEQAWEDFKQNKLGASSDISDEELARRLQEEEERQAIRLEQQSQQEAAARNQQVPQQPPVRQGQNFNQGASSSAASSPSSSTRSERDKKGSCIVL